MQAREREKKQESCYVAGGITGLLLSYILSPGFVSETSEKDYQCTYKFTESVDLKRYICYT